MSVPGVRRVNAGAAARDCTGRTLAMGVAIALAVSSLGCGKGSGSKYAREPFSGTVTLDGQPLMGGYVAFEPKEGQPTQSGGMIEGGKFNVPKEKGAVPGKYSVAIFSGAVRPPNNFEPGTPEYEAAAMRGPGEMVPRKYNVDSILTAEVKAGGDNVFPFELSSKK